MKVTNNSHALQGVQTLRGVVFLKPGEARDDLDMDEKQAERAGRLKFLNVKGQPSKAAPSDPASFSAIDIPPNEVDQLRKQLADATAEIEKLKAALVYRDAEMVKLKDVKEEPAKTPAEVLAMASDPNVPFMSFKSAAAKLLGDKTTSKKDEIVAALEDLATQP